MKIQSGVLDAASQQPSPNVGGAITPAVIVMHYTAGYTASSAIQTFLDSGSRVSAHFVIGLDGAITQMVDCDRAGWHAGPSTWDGRAGVNNFSVGIEIVNPGFFRRDGDQFVDAYGKRPPKAFLEQCPGYIDAPDARAGSGTFAWPLYREEQLAAVDGICAALTAAYPSIRGVTGHRDIDNRGWKLDPGPAFPMRRYQRLFNVRDDAPDEAIVNTAVLNVRDAPSPKGAKIGELRRGARVTVLAASGDWRRIDGPAKADGWVHGSFLTGA